MRHELAAAALAGVLLTASCGSGSEGAETDVDGLERAPVDVLMTGVVGPAVSDRNTFTIEQVLWERGPRRDEGGSLVIPVSLDPGDEVELAAGTQLVVGSRYVVLANQTATSSGTAAFDAYGAIDPSTNVLVIPFAPDPVDLLLPGEGGVTSPIEALVELLRDSTRFHSAENAPRPLTRRLAHAFQLAELRRGGSVTIGGDQLEDFLLLDSSRRAIPAGVEFPEIVVETLGMRPFQARVVLPKRFAGRHWAIGFLTPAGIVGPVVLAPGQTIVDVDGLRADRRAIRLVAWRSDPGSTAGLRDAARFVGTSDFRAEVAAVSKSMEAGASIELDVSAGTVTVGGPPSGDGVSAAGAAG